MFGRVVAKVRDFGESQLKERLEGRGNRLLRRGDNDGDKRPRKQSAFTGAYPRRS